MCLTSKHTQVVFVVNLAPIDETEIGTLFPFAINNCPHIPAPVLWNDPFDVVPISDYRFEQPVLISDYSSEEPDRWCSRSTYFPGSRYREGIMV